jgi:hypothetical protein
VADAGARGDDREIVERLRAPFQELVALGIALIFERDVFLERLGRAEFVDHHRVIDDEVDGHLRIDLGGIAAELGDRIAHRGEIDHAGHAGEILHQHAGRAILDLAVRARVLLPVDDRLGIVPGDGHAVLEAQHVLEQHLHREGQAADVAELLRGLGQREKVIAGGADGERVASAEGIVADGGHGARGPFPVCPVPGARGTLAHHRPRGRTGVLRMRRFGGAASTGGRGGEGEGRGRVYVSLLPDSFRTHFRLIQ